ncbi:Inherit from strNOG: K03714 glycoprotein 2-beta-D-xylosyltransferase [Seminavis robusta]|uniref:Inherit from strNOG: K03714 glycoprotein 2-beta-D-xylosyltransferase n=1 Tax=Seminavis robusta TaxID=568900 RepID=A0A9N8HUC5_9STRA|nr:Inherit from strNOG: K03714 glycoprotein 2-beta-D-xylosyltransferase [Seminavis robusta]|eukprot:Sro1727_g293890.1 Inherit from strNOG: K03714 glycoprotein 2-beta-D-xylosyltransferase EC 2.4.2.38 (635) ;mRNA; r:4111-6015
MEGINAKTLRRRRLSRFPILKDDDFRLFAALLGSTFLIHVLLFCADPVAESSAGTTSTSAGWSMIHDHLDLIRSKKAVGSPKFKDKWLEITKRSSLLLEDTPEANRLKDSNFSKPEAEDGECSQFLGYPKESSPNYSICLPTTKPPKNEKEHHRDAAAGGELWCQWNPLLNSSFCQATNLIVDPSKINVAQGGEAIYQVLGREEQDEMPTYESGALQLSQCTLSEQHINRKDLPYHLFHMVNSLREQREDSGDTLMGGEVFGTDNVECSSYEERPTLLVTRYEYANLYHTYSDWYSAYQAAMIALHGNQTAVENVHIVFFDGHAQAKTDMGWKLLFSHATVSYISEYKNIDKKEPACFRHVIFAPAGYLAPTSLTPIKNLVGFMDQGPNYFETCKENKWQRRFRNTLVINSKRQLANSKAWLYDHYAVEHHDNKRDPFPCLHPKAPDDPNQQQVAPKTKKQPKKRSLRVLLLARANYQAHPRMDGRVSRIIQNEKQLLHFLETYKGPEDDRLPEYNFPQMDVKRVVLEEHDMAEQIVTFQQADVVVGMHGAGLTHILLARPGTTLLEIRPPSFRGWRHFEFLAQIAGCLHRSHQLEVNDRPIDPTDSFSIPIKDFELAFMESVSIFLDNQCKLQ